MKTGFRLALIAICLFVTFPNAVDASPGYTRDITYYVGCGGESEVVGGAYRSCNGYWTYWGQQSGDWKEVHDEHCQYQASYTDYYEYCGGQWVLVPYVDCEC
jgi:hypothetical protein